MAYTEQEAGMMAHEVKSAAKHSGMWGVLGTLLGAAGTATGITALATKVPKNGGCGNHNGYGNGNCGGPTSFEAYQKSCNDEVALASAFYQGRINQLEERYSDRQGIDREMFGLYKSQVDADFGLYKNQRDGFDVLASRIGNLETKVAVNEAVRPYQDKLIQCEIDRAYTSGINYTDRKTCRMIQGVVVLPDSPTLTGYASNPCGCPPLLASVPVTEN